MTPIIHSGSGYTPSLREQQDYQVIMIMLMMIVILLMVML